MPCALYYKALYSEDLWEFDLNLVVVQTLIGKKAVAETFIEKS